jgi:hypothetical protein
MQSMSALLIFAGAALGAGGIARATALPPDTIIFDGRFITVDSHDSIAQALAIRAGKIIAIGANGDVLRLAAAGTRRRICAT